MKRIAIIGAGLAGLTLALEMDNCAEVLVFEKSRAAGGRMATRVAGPYQFDHGAQFFTARDPRFKTFLAPYIKQGHIAVWRAGFAEFSGNRVTARRRWDDAPAHYVGAPRMNSIAARLAAGLRLRLKTEITRLEGRNGRWLAYDQAGRAAGEFDWVISAIPAAQAARLLPARFLPRAAIRQKSMLACYSLMLGFAEPLRLDWQAALVAGADISWLSKDNSKPGRPASAALLAHSTNQWAEAHIDADQAYIKDHLCKEVERVTGAPIGQADHIGLHRWRYANIGRQAGAGYFIDSAARLAACGDWCLHGRVEAAFLSACRLADGLKAAL